MICRVCLSGLRMKINQLPSALLFFVYGLACSVGVVFGGAYGAIGIGGALLLTGALWLSQGRFPALNKRAAWLAGAFLLACCLSWGASLDVAVAWRTTLKIATICLPLLLFLSPDLLAEARVTPRHLLLLGGVLAAGVFLHDLVLISRLHAVIADKEFEISKWNRGFSYAALVALPLVGGLFFVDNAKRWPHRLAFLILVLLGATTFFSNSRATATGLVLAAAVWGLARLWPRLVLWGGRLAVLLSSGWAFYAAAIALRGEEGLKAIPPSWQARVEIWNYMAYRLIEKPWSGYGIGNSHLVSIDVPSTAGTLFGHAASHPHNAMIQLWGELGVFGLALGLFLAFWTLDSASRLPAWLRPYGFAAFALAFWLALVAYNFWTDSLWASFTLTALAFSVLAARGEKLKFP